MNDSEREQIQNLLDAVHPSSSGSQELTTTMDEYPERPPSVVLEAVTLKQQAYDTSTITSSTIALEVPTILKVLLKIQIINQITINFRNAASQKLSNQH